MRHDYLPRIGYTNDISFRMVKNWKPGNRFVIQKQDNNAWVEDPKEIIIASVEELTDEESTSIGYNQRITGECGTIVDISSILMSPTCAEYDIYKNWSTYFRVNFNKMKGKKTRLAELEKYLEKFRLFEKKFRDKNPEKLI